VAAGQFHSLAVSKRGEVFAFGCDDTGQLGLGRGHGYNPYQLYETSLQARLANVTVPERIAALAGRHIVAIAAGTHHSLFLSREGHVFSCGMDKYGYGLGSYLFILCSIPKLYIYIYIYLIIHLCHDID
jgi:regulator of chromosome condensation